ncbi:MAG: DUF3048 domain-containing protein, partial [Acidimicrobiales bacterium]
MSSLLTRPFQTLWGRIALGVGAVVIIGVVLVLATGNDSEEAQTQVLVQQEEPTPTTAATAEPTPTPSPEPTATTAPTPTPTPTPGPVSPLNGMSVDAPSTTRLLTVKIDNHANARPQSGIQNADMMVEIWVEGITRFLSVWQDSEAEFLGPIRSMRPTDFSIQNSWESTFVNSGGQAWVQSIGRASSSRYFVEPRGSFRVSFRFAPHNLYGDTTAFRTLDDRGDYEAPLAPLWNFGEMPADAPEATSIATNWSSSYVVG